MGKIERAFAPPRSARIQADKLGSAGYDNPRENIDPEIKTQTISLAQGTVEQTPTADNHIANKKYVDDNAGGGGSSYSNILYVGTTGSSADYECDGTADQVQIQQAIDACETAGGGIVELSADTFNFTARIQMKTDVHLRGQGFSTLLYQTNSSQANCFAQTERDNWSISNLKINMNGANNTTGGGWAVWSEDCDDCLVKNVLIINPRMAGVGWSYDSVGCNYCKCVRVKVQDKTGSLTADLLATESSNNCGFIDCEVINTNLSTDNGIGLYGGTSEAVTDARGSYAIGCTATECANGFNVEHSDSAKVVGCVGFGNTRAGINLSSSAQNATITGNNFYDNEYGIACDETCSNITFTGNNIYSNDADGALIEADNTVFNGNNVQNNDSHGVWIVGADNFIANNNLLVDNGIGTTWKSGFHIQQCSNLQIQNNQITNTTNTYCYKAIYCTGAQSYGLITGNLIDGMYKNGVEVRTGCTYTLIANNVIVNCVVYGVDTSSGTNTGTEVRDNVYDGNGTDENL